MLSIVIPVKNEKAYTSQILKEIERCIKSDYEIIIIDDNSNDGTYELLANKEKMSILHYDYDIGVNQARSIGVEQAKGDYILVINNDILLTEGIDLEMIKEFDNPDTKVVCPYSTQGTYKRELPVFMKQDNICGWCYMIKKDNDFFPIPQQLDIWYGDDWIYNECNKQIAYVGLVHHFGSKTLKTKEQQSNIWARIENDKKERAKICRDNSFNTNQPHGK